MNIASSWGEKAPISPDDREPLNADETSLPLSRSSTSDSLASTSSLAYQLPPFPTTFPGLDVVDFFKLVRRRVWSRMEGSCKNEKVKEENRYEMMISGYSKK
ncbi:hypothetical protein IAR50_004326 [Cryptococcus sp. DSM 104548]